MMTTCPRDEVGGVVDSGQQLSGTPGTAAQHQTHNISGTAGAVVWNEGQGVGEG